MNKLAILGSNGYVGRELKRHCTELGIQFVCLDRRHTKDSEALYAALLESNVDHLINCAGFTGKPNVDACELHKAECLMGNSVLPGVVGEACLKLGIPWGHVSSGCIFTGRRADGEGFRETDAPNFSFRQNNCSFYSGTKALGEEILSQADQCYIWRLRIPFENTANPRNYLQKVMSYEKLLEAENSLSHLGEFVAGCVDSFRLKIPYGIYNLTNPGSVTTREVVDLIKASGVCQKDFQFFQDESDFMLKAAKTPRSNCVLDSSKALAAGLSFRPVQDALRECLASWKS